MRKQRSRHFGLFISFLFCSFLAAAISLWQMSFQEDTHLGKLLSWANGCFAAAALWTSLGLLMLIASFDGFRAIQYLGYTFRLKWSKNRDSESRLESYYEYMQKKRKEQGERRMVKLFLLPGILYLAAAVVLTIVFERMR